MKHTAKFTQRFPAPLKLKITAMAAYFYCEYVAGKCAPQLKN